MSCRSTVRLNSLESCIRLPEDVELCVLVLRESLEELLQEPRQRAKTHFQDLPFEGHQHVIGHALLIMRPQAGREAHPRRLIHPHHVCSIVPGRRISVGVLTWRLFTEVNSARRRSWPLCRAHSLQRARAENCIPGPRRATSPKVPWTDSSISF